MLLRGTMRNLGTFTPGGKLRVISSAKIHTLRHIAQARSLYQRLSACSWRVVTIKSAQQLVFKVFMTIKSVRGPEPSAATRLKINIRQISSPRGTYAFSRHSGGILAVSGLGRKNHCVGETYQPI